MALACKRYGLAEMGIRQSISCYNKANTMNIPKEVKTCLLVSYGPVPTPEYQTVEGGGMRIWGLAKGLKDNGISPTVSINSGFPLSIKEHEGIELTNWQLDAKFLKEINSYDAVIVSYCMGDVSVFIADNIRDEVQLILDVYVPIYIEVSAREAKEMNVEYVNYMADLQRHNHTLMRGDYFLYANPAQEKLYTGALGALGIINPYSYHNERLLYAPFGIHRDSVVSTTNPYLDLGLKKEDFIVLWFGGIYPWFRIEEYLESINSLSKADMTFKFVFVGGKNPFNANEDISRQYTKAVEFAHSNKIFDKSVFFVDWVDFNTRINWFRNANVIVSLNQPGKENIYSWRTRVMDFVWGEAATITNGGDPLSEEMVDNGAALKIDSLSSESISSALQALKENPKELKSIEHQVRLLKNKYYWDTTTKIVSEVIQYEDHPYKRELSLRKLIDSTIDGSPTPTPSIGKLEKVTVLSKKVLRKIRQKGIRSTARVALDIAIAQSRRTIVKREPQFIFISHPIDNTGAPIVLIQMIEEYVEKYGASRVRVFAPGILRNQENHLKSIGIKLEKAIYGADFRFIRLQLALQPDDFVMINTIAIYDTYRDFILLWLRLGRLKHAYWFIHEDKAQIPIINPPFVDKENLSRITEAVNSKRLTLLFPSKRTADEYEEILGVKGAVIKLRVEIPDEYKKIKTRNDFDKINILLSGTSGDGRKGQLLALSALQYFADNFYNQNRDNYRPVTLNLLAIGDKDYISHQIRWIAKSAISDLVKIYDILPKNEAMRLAFKCNVVLCCSLNETFGLYIAEGMLMGHVLLRNNTAGVDEQLHEDQNGFLIDHTDIKSIAMAIERLANKNTMTSSKLQSFSKNSMLIMDEYTKSS
jgi:glycosyltransferase involved in cell wall biosynthesis